MTPNVPDRSLPTRSGAALPLAVAGALLATLAAAAPPCGPYPAAAAGSSLQVTRFGGVNNNARPSLDGRFIVFDSQRRAEVPPGHAGRTVRVMELASGREEVLTAGRRDQAPSFSPDGRRIVFESYRDGAPHLYLVNRDGSEPRRLTSTPGYHSSGDFSPDGSRIAWFTGPTYDEADVWIMDADGGSPRAVVSEPGADTYPSWAPDGRRLVFTSHRHGNTELFLLDLATGAQTRLTDHPAGDDHARFSPDGRRVVFESWRRGFGGIFILDVERRTLEHLPVEHEHAYLPTWTPDGQAILYHARTPEGTEIFRAAVAGACAERAEGEPTNAPADGGPRRLTDSAANEATPAWSPDGRHLAYVSDGDADDWGDDAIHLHELATGTSGRLRRSKGDAAPDWSAAARRILYRTSTRDERSQICWSRSDGRGAACLPPIDGLRGRPRWSPDGTRIAYAAPGASAESALHVVAIATGSAVELATGGDAWNPAWSPDGTTLLFTSGRDGDAEIYAVAAAGGAPRRLTRDPASDDQAVFSPDGRRIAFVSDRDGNHEVYLMPAGGGAAVNLTRHPAWDGQPAWAPSGDGLAFASKRRGNLDVFLVEPPPDGDPAAGAGADR